MARFELKGMDSLINKLEKLSNTPDRVKKKLVHEGAKVALNQMKTDANGQFHGTGTGAANLAVIETRDGAGYLFVDVGIGESNWYECRGLYFQHYGFYSKPPTQWMNVSFNKSKPQVKRIIKDGLSRELKL